MGGTQSYVAHVTVECGQGSPGREGGVWVVGPLACPSGAFTVGDIDTVDAARDVGGGGEWEVSA